MAIATDIFLVRMQFFLKLIDLPSSCHFGPLTRWNMLYAVFALYSICTLFFPIKTLHIGDVLCTGLSFFENEDILFWLSLISKVVQVIVLIRNV